MAKKLKLNEISNIIAGNGRVLLQAGNSLLCPTPTADE